MRTITHLNIVVVSPSDVTEERNIVEKVVEELNLDVALDRSLRLDVVRWETDTYPGFHPSGPQGLIDPILRIDESDIVIGIFWKHFGTATAGAESGTEHEFEMAYQSWKKQDRHQILFYFNQKPYTPRNAEEAEQTAKVFRFKEKYPKEGLWFDYNGVKDFEQKLRRHLRNYIRKEFAFPQGAVLQPKGQRYFVERLRSPETIYGALCSYLTDHPYFFNTIFSSSEGVFPIDPHRQSYYDLKLQLIVNEKLKCKELYSGKASNLYSEQMNTLTENAGGQVIRLPARFDVRRIEVPNLTSVVGFCVFLKSENDLKQGVLMFGWLLDEGSVWEDQECLITNQPDIVELYARHFLQLHGAAEKHEWPV